MLEGETNGILSSTDTAINLSQFISRHYMRTNKSIRKSAQLLCENHVEVYYGITVHTQHTEVVYHYKNYRVVMGDSKKEI